MVDTHYIPAECMDAHKDGRTEEWTDGIEDWVTGWIEGWTDGYKD